MKRWLPDKFILALLGTVALASLIPATGRAVPVVDWASNLAIGLLFFLHGARLSRKAILDGLRQPGLHVTVFASTFVLFPLLGLGLETLFPHLVAPELWTGVLFVCTLSSTVQSSIAFTSIARGNVPAAVCAATASNLLGIVVTPLLVTGLLHRHGGDGAGGDDLTSAFRIVAQLLLPFVAGQALRPWIGAWAKRHNRLLGFVDRGTILIAVYGAFGAAVVEGIWHLFPPFQLGQLVIANAILLGLVLTITTFGARLLGFKRADEIVLVFCGSKKSLAAGIPMATVLFGASTAGIVLLPIMIFHQMQLMVCAVLARRYAAGAPAEAVPAPAE
ncbi:MAG TPA: bile acid:sodium symporter family protein [Dongiaceae bacterium]|jgi:sodium/bile acid cotransporter 7